ncbi:MAG: MBL fold metallo-hydrolase [Chlorobiaceae bacterium]|nr:MBL fold metallo-hydrolase [Chlorobiaceae bacterium]
MELEFYGATHRVTGSCHILRAGGHTILLDCGLVQGGPEDDAVNREPFPFDPDSIDAVVLSHGHIDHSGRIPLLVKRGFNGPIYTHEATAELCRVLLKDSASLSEHDALRRRRHGYGDAEPLYTVEEALLAVDQMHGLRYGKMKEILPGISIRLHDAGHILGSAFVELEVTEGEVRRTLVFSGDIGQYGTPIMNDPSAIGHADYVIVESTYGDRLHRSLEETVSEIGEIIDAAHRDHGNVLIPSFAVGRSQELLYLLGQHYHEWDLPRWQVYLDSPMAIEAGKIYWGHPELWDDEAKLFRKELRRMPPLGNLHLTGMVDQSIAINSVRQGAIIVAGSGMCNGGRIIHHLKNNIWRPECHVLIIGFQALGTLGRRLVDGQHEVHINGTSFRVAAKIHTVGGLSAHGDRDDLLRWLGSCECRPAVFIVHGEDRVKEIFRETIKASMSLEPEVPMPGQILDLGSGILRSAES